MSNQVEESVFVSCDDKKYIPYMLRKRFPYITEEENKKISLFIFNTILDGTR